MSQDNDRGIATGWLPGRLSERGRALAAELGERRLLHDWRLRECDYGRWNGASTVQVHQDRSRYIDRPYPGGESWRQAVHRAGRFLDDLPLRWSGARVLVIGHVATRWAFDHFIDGTPIEDLAGADFGWREGWEYRLA